MSAAAASARVAAAAQAAGRMVAWRAHAYGAGELRLEAARVPALRAPDDVLVRVRAASLNPLDAAMLRGYGSTLLGLARAADGVDEFPLVCGRDFLGEVERAGPAAALRRGDRVWGVVPPHRAGAHATHVLVRDRWAGRAPAVLTDAECGGAGFAALSAAAAVRAAGAGVRRALLLGLGGVGQAALQLLAAAGAAVTVAARADAAPLAADLGAAHTIDRDAPDYYQQIEATGPYCVVVDCAGVGGQWAGLAAARGARLVTLTSPLLRETDARGLAAGGARALGALAAHSAAAGAPCPRVRWAYFQPRAADLERVRRLADRGRFRVVVERLYPWWDADLAYQRMARGGARGKLVLDWTADPALAH